MQAKPVKIAATQLFKQTSRHSISYSRAGHSSIAKAMYLFPFCGVLRRLGIDKHLLLTSRKVIFNQILDCLFTFTPTYTPAPTPFFVCHPFWLWGRGGNSCREIILHLNLHCLPDVLCLYISRPCSYFRTQWPLQNTTSTVREKGVGKFCTELHRKITLSRCQREQRSKGSITECRFCMPSPVEGSLTRLSSKERNLTVTAWIRLKKFHVFLWNHHIPKCHSSQERWK